MTLLYSSHYTEHNNAVALKEYLDGKSRGAETQTVFPSSADDAKGLIKTAARAGPGGVPGA